MSVNKLSGFMEAHANIAAEVTRDAGGGSNAKQAIDLRGKVEWAVGTGADQADQIWEDRRTLAGGATEDLELQDGTESNGFGQTLTLTILKGIYINIVSGDGPLLIGGAVANQFDSLFGDVSDKFRVRKTIMVATGDATGYAVDADDVLKIANEDGGAAVTFDIVIIGKD